MAYLWSWKKTTLVTVGVAAGFGIYYSLNVEKGKSTFLNLLAPSIHLHRAAVPYNSGPLPKRSELIDHLMSTPEFDVLVIGGGATGSGVALDAVTRGLKTALVERDDFASGTSSRSTKLVHGGVRYLQQAILGLDLDQAKLVMEALFERFHMLTVAPHLAQPLPIMLPFYKWWQIPYYWVGIKMYDLISGNRLVRSSFAVDSTKAIELFPLLNPDKLKGAVVYYDGQQDDARFNLGLITTSIRYGAAAANYVEVTGIVKKELVVDGVRREVVCGVKLHDRITGKEWVTHAKCVVNATGPWVDTIRSMADPGTSPICRPSSGVHIALPSYYCSPTVGLLDPSTSDGRVIFVLPWQGRTIAGTTDKPCDLSFSPTPQESDIEFILKEMQKFYNSSVQVRRQDVLSAWNGIRPLVTDPNTTDTKSLVRNHVIEVGKSKLLTIAGGKWTTYRSMSQDTVDEAIRSNNLNAPYPTCQTPGIALDGAEGWSGSYFVKLIRDYNLDEEVARHLSHSYGSKAADVLGSTDKVSKTRMEQLTTRLVEGFPYIQAEVIYGCKEYACTAVDMISRRMRLSFLDSVSAMKVVPTVVSIMAAELGWDSKTAEAQRKMAYKFLQQQMNCRVQEDL